MLSHLSRKLIKYLWNLFAVVVVTLAILFTIIKYSLPEVERFKVDIEQYLQTNFGAQVSIGQIGAQWHINGPAIILSELQVTATRQAPLDIELDSIQVEVDFWQSLWQQSFVSDTFILDGARVWLDSSVFFKVRPESQGSQLFESLSQLFLSQLKDFKVINSAIVVRHKDGSLQEYKLDDLSWQNFGNRHQAKGDVYVDGFSDNSINLQLDLYGQQRSTIFGDIYVQAKGMDISPWLTQFIDESATVRKTNAEFEAWLSVKQGFVDNILFNVTRGQLQWQSQQTEQTFELADGQLLWRRNNSGWQIVSEPLTFVSNSIAYYGAQVTVKGADQGLQVDVANLSLAPFADLLSILEVNALDTLFSQIDVSGEVTSATIHYGETWSGKVALSKAGWLPSEIADPLLVGLSDLNVNVTWFDNLFSVDVSGEQGLVIDNDMFSSAFEYDKLTLSAQIALLNHAPRLTISDFQLRNRDLNIRLQSQYVMTEQGFVDLYAELRGPRMGTINQYLPKHLLSESLYDYLQTAIQHGQGTLNQVVLSGNMEQFPFVNVNQGGQRGRFIVNSQFDNGLFRFAPDWPMLEEMTANLLVDNNAMSISVKSGQFAGLTINNDAVATIPLDAEQTWLQLMLTPESLQFEQFHNLVTSTPLNDILGDVFEFVKLSGSGNATVNLSIPLFDSEDAQVNASGSVVAQQSSMTMDSIGIGFEQVDALVSFNNDAFEVAAHNATWLGLPVTFDVTGGQQDQYAIKGKLKADWHANDLKQANWGPLTGYLTGSVSSVVDVSVGIDDNGDAQYFVDGYSDLFDAGYDVLPNLAKPRKRAANMQWSLLGDVNSMDIAANLGQQMNFAARFNLNDATQNVARLTIGKPLNNLPERGFDILFDVQEAAFEPTLQLVFDIIDSLPESDNEGPSIMPELTDISGISQSLGILGLDWQNVSVKARPTAQNWLFSIGAKQTLMEVTVPNDVSQGIAINAEFLNIETANYRMGPAPLPLDDEQAELNDEPALTGSDELIRSLPPFKANCKVCTFDGKPLGLVTLATHTEGPELIIDTLNMDYKRNTAQFNGRWIGDSGAGRTLAQGNIKSRYFGDWLKELGFDTGIKDSDATINIDTRWHSAPYDLDFASLDGKVDFRLGEGYLSEISDQGARLFSIFSLDSLYRKLKFDFNDIFSKGLFYNSIRGDLTIKSGVVYSDNIRMDGLAGDMRMSGFTDLNSQTLDYNVAFKPKLTSSLGVLSWLAASNPITIIGAFALDKIIEGADVISEVRLKVTGDISKPDVKEVERFTKKVTIPKEELPKEIIDPTSLQEQKQ